MANTKDISNIQSKIDREEDGTIKISITIPWKDVAKAQDKIVNDFTKQVNVPGFRKGAAPAHIAKEKLDPEKVNEETLKKILPQAYVESVNRHNLKPIINPRIHVEAFAQGTDLKFSASTCEEPEVKLKNYKEEIKKLTAASKIIIPGKEQKKPSMDEIVKKLLESADANISKIIVENEVNRLLSQLLDELKSLGMTLEQYLSSKGKNGEQLRSEYEQKAINDLKLEFILRKIADEEKIAVEQKDIDEVIAKIQDEKQKADVSKNSYVLSTIIRQQKTLDFLAKL